MQFIKDFIGAIIGFIIAAIAIGLLIFFIGCARIPFPTCSTPKAVRCDGEVAQRCEGGHWYTDHDCSETGQQCIVKGGGGDEVVRCE